MKNIFSTAIALFMILLTYGVAFTSVLSMMQQQLYLTVISSANQQSQFASQFAK
jgi:hypothetical protein